MRTFRVLGWAVVLALFLGHVAGLAKTTEIELARETRLDPASLSGTPRIFRVKDVLFRVFVQKAATTKLDEDLNVDINGFQATLPKGLVLTKRAFVGSPNPRMFSKADGFGTALDGEIYCNEKWIKVGPFTSGATLSRFTAIPCLIDAENDGIFDSLAFFSLNTKDIGPVPILPLRYRPVAGDLNQEHVDMVIQRVGDSDIFVTPILYDTEGKHSRIRLYTDERDRTLTDYANGCVFKARKSMTTSSAFGAQISITAVDARAGTFQATITPSNELKRVDARIKNWQYMYDFLPTFRERCGDKR